MDDRTEQSGRPGGSGTPSAVPLGTAEDKPTRDEPTPDEPTRAEDAQDEPARAEDAPPADDVPPIQDDVPPVVQDAPPAEDTVAHQAEDTAAHRPGETATAASGSAPAWEIPDYVHERELGAGASGRVVLAHHRETGTPVAIKYLHDRIGTPALRAEAEVLARIDSPHITRLYEYVEGERGSAIVMELVDGIALRDLLRAEGATTAQAALVVLKGSLLGLAAAHEAGVVHRDYKPANVLVDTAGTSKLVDFGIAVPSGDDRDVSGTPAYMPPEQWAGRPASPAGDVYAATVTFFECLTGARPYGGATIAELAVQHAEAPIPADLAPDVVRPLIVAGLAKDPEARPDSAAAFVRELEAVATAGYGPGWEERGRLDLLGLLALLAALLPGAGVAGGATSLAHTSLGSQGSGALGSQGAAQGSGTLGSQGVAPAPGAAPEVPADGVPADGALRRVPARRGVLARNRGKALTGVAAGAVALATLAGLAAAGATDGGARTAVGAASPEATTSIGPQQPTDGGTSPAPSGDGVTVSPTPSASDPTASPSTTATTAATPSGAPTASPSAKAPTAAAVPTPSSPGRSAAPSTPAAPAPTTAAPSAPVTTPPSPSPTVAPATLTVGSVNLDSMTCSGRWSLSATATVTAQGVGSGTLTFSWYHSSGGRAITVATDTVPVQNGTATVTRAHDFGSADTFSTWGVRVSTTPAAAKQGKTSAETAAFLCNPPR
ncbi:protein kinase [Kitasatospora sp. NPDC059577]|uniref:protein kinase domain-containing protein n=1 Tax=Kitasatospora sp. NPDC059577 TaxID=3346873 RepID=UPI0036B5B8EC